MQQFSRVIASWLQSCPGIIKGKDDEEVFALARLMFMRDRRIRDDREVPMAEFMKLLDIRGYRTHTRTDHSTGQVFTVLQLPEKARGF